VTDWRTIAAELADSADALLKYDAHLNESHGIRNLLDLGLYGGSMCSLCGNGRDFYVNALQASIHAFDVADETQVEEAAEA